MTSAQTAASGGQRSEPGEVQPPSPNTAPQVDDAWGNWRGVQGWGSWARASDQGWPRENAEGTTRAVEGASTANGDHSASNGAGANGYSSHNDNSPSTGGEERGPQSGSWNNGGWYRWGSNNNYTSYGYNSWHQQGWGYNGWKSPTVNVGGGKDDKDAPSFDGNTKKLTLQQYFRRIAIWEATTVPLNNPLLSSTKN